MRVYISRSSRHKVEEIQRDQLSLLIKIFAFFLERDERFRRTKTSSIRTRTKHTRYHSKALFCAYRSMCVSFLCIHLCVHLKRVKDGSFSPLKNSCGSILKKKIFTFLETLFSKTHKNRLNSNENEAYTTSIQRSLPYVSLDVRFVSLYSLLFTSRARQRWSILECIHFKFTRIFYSKSSLVSTHFAQITREKFNMNPGEKQAEIYTYEAPWLIYACNWSVRRLRSFCCLCVVHIALYVALFLSLTLCL